MIFYWIISLLPPDVQCIVINFCWVWNVDQKEDTTVPEIKDVMVDTAAPENLVDTAVEETVVTDPQKSLQILLQKVPVSPLSCAIY